MRVRPYFSRGAGLRGRAFGGGATDCMEWLAQPVGSKEEAPTTLLSAILAYGIK